MLTDPLTLFDQTIDNLELLAALLADEIDERVQNPQAQQGIQDTMSLHRATHGKIRILLPILRAARAAQEDLSRATRPSYCLHCD